MELHNILIITLSSIILISNIIGIILINKTIKVINDLRDYVPPVNTEDVEKNKRPMNMLSFQEVQMIINERIDDLWKTKYLLYYTIREIKVIPNMPKEIEDFANELLDSLSEDLYKNILLYYSKEYFVKMITRQAQILMVDYTNTNKPVTK